MGRRFLHGSREARVACVCRLTWLVCVCGSRSRGLGGGGRAGHTGLGRQPIHHQQPASHGTALARIRQGGQWRSQEACGVGQPALHRPEVEEARYVWRMAGGGGYRGWRCIWTLRACMRADTPRSCRREAVTGGGDCRAGSRAGGRGVGAGGAREADRAALEPGKSATASCRCLPSSQGPADTRPYRSVCVCISWPL